MPDVDALLSALLVVFLFGTILAGVAISVVSIRRPRTFPLVIAGCLVLLSLVVVAVVPIRLDVLVGALLALPAVALAAVGGNPVTRRILDIATHGRVHETNDGGILVGDAEDERVQLRGGTTIGYLERVGVALAVIAGYPEAIAVVVAVKGIGRFSELASAEARERFIIGTLASLLWACAVAGIVRLALT